MIADRVGETPCAFLAGLYRAERTIADRLAQLACGTLPWPPIDPDRALPWVEKRICLALAESQVAAIRLALTSKVLVMTGGPASARPQSLELFCGSSRRRARSFRYVRRLAVLPSGCSLMSSLDSAMFNRTLLNEK